MADVVALPADAEVSECLLKLVGYPAPDTLERALAYFREYAATVSCLLQDSNLRRLVVCSSCYAACLVAGPPVKLSDVVTRCRVNLVTVSQTVDTMLAMSRAVARQAHDEARKNLRTLLLMWCSYAESFPAVVPAASSSQLFRAGWLLFLCSRSPSTDIFASCSNLLATLFILRASFCAATEAGSIVVDHLSSGNHRRSPDPHGAGKGHGGSPTPSGRFVPSLQSFREFVAAFGCEMGLLLPNDMEGMDGALQHVQRVLTELRAVDVALVQEVPLEACPLLLNCGALDASLAALLVRAQEKNPVFDETVLLDNREDLFVLRVSLGREAAQAPARCSTDMESPSSATREPVKAAVVVDERTVSAAVVMTLADLAGPLNSLRDADAMVLPPNFLQFLQSRCSVSEPSIAGFENRVQAVADTLSAYELMKERVPCARLPLALRVFAVLIRSVLEAELAGASANIGALLERVDFVKALVVVAVLLVLRAFCGASVRPLQMVRRSLELSQLSVLDFVAFIRPVAINFAIKPIPLSVSLFLREVEEICLEELAWAEDSRLFVLLTQRSLREQLESALCRPIGSIAGSSLLAPLPSAPLGPRTISAGAFPAASVPSNLRPDATQLLSAAGLPLPLPLLAQAALSPQPSPSRSASTVGASGQGTAPVTLSPAVHSPARPTPNAPLPMALRIFFMRLFHSVGIRISRFMDLFCRWFPLAPPVRDSMETQLAQLFTHLVIHHFDILRNRQVDVILLSCFYALYKLHDQRVTFRKLVSAYEEAQREIRPLRQLEDVQGMYKRVMGLPEATEDRTIVEFYNSVFVPVAKDFILAKFRGKNPGAGPDTTVTASPHLLNTGVSSCVSEMDSGMSSFASQPIQQQASPVPPSRQLRSFVGNVHLSPMLHGHTKTAPFPMTPSTRTFICFESLGAAKRPVSVDGGDSASAMDALNSRLQKRQKPSPFQEIASIVPAHESKSTLADGLGMRDGVGVSQPALSSSLSAAAAAAAASLSSASSAAALSLSHPPVALIATQQRLVTKSESRFR